MRSDVGFSGLVVSAFLVEEEVMAGKHGGAPRIFGGHSIGTKSTGAHVRAVGEHLFTHGHSANGRVGPKIVQQTLPYQTLEEVGVWQLLGRSKRPVVNADAGRGIGIPFLAALNRLTQEHRLPSVEVFRPGCVDDIQYLA